MMAALRHAALAGALLSMQAAALADTCMVSPTAKQEVSGRFGKFRGGGGANHGSGNSRPHMHDGLDFSTSGSAAPLKATADGTVTWAKMRGTAGNTVMIKRPNGEFIVYYHLSSIAVKEGQQVAAGDVIGRSGATGMRPGGAVHLHFIYGVKNTSDVRAKSFSAEAVKNKTFDPSQLPNVIKQNTFNYATDPSPYFCQTFPIQNDGLASVLGGDTKAQYAKLFGAVPPAGAPPAAGLEPVQVAAANGDALQAQAQGAPNVASMLNDADGFGSLPTPPLGDIESMSPAEMMATEARRRFADAQWNIDIIKVSSRALWVDYLRALGVSSYMNEALRQKKERVEALLALYTAQKLALKKARTTATQTRAAENAVSSAIK